jgi:hypothetical protein
MHDERCQLKSVLLLGKPLAVSVLSRCALVIVLICFHQGKNDVIQGGTAASNPLTVPTVSSSGNQAEIKVVCGANFQFHMRSTSARVIGSNAYGQLGMGTTTNQGSWQSSGITLPAQDTTQTVCAGAFHACARSATGVRCWGRNGNAWIMPALY